MAGAAEVSMRWNLYYGRRKMAEVVPDEHWPEMWRVHIDDHLSDMVNIVRAKDAADLLTRQRHPQCTNPTLWHWKAILSHQEGTTFVKTATP